MDVDGKVVVLRSKLQKTFHQLFLKDIGVHDDTLLANLCDWLQSQLNIDNEKCSEIVGNLESVKWIQALGTKWNTMNDSVVAFGLKVLGALSSTSTGCVLLDANAAVIRLILFQLESSYTSTKPSIRFAYLTLLTAICDASVSFLPKPSTFIKSAVQGLEDESIFVKRCAGNLLVKLFALPAYTDYPWKPVVLNLLNWLVITDGESSKSMEKGRAALDVLQDLLLMHFRVPMHLDLMTVVQSEIPECIRSIRVDSLHVFSWQLLTYLNIGSFVGDTPPATWVDFLNDLLQSRSSINGSDLLIATCKSLGKCEIKVPFWLTSAMLRPVVVASGWRSSGESSLMVCQLPVWEQHTKDFKIADSASARLVDSILNNVAFFEMNFAETRHRLDLLDLLFCYLSYCNTFVLQDVTQKEKVAALHQKHQKAAMYAITKLIQDWGGEWVTSLNIDAQQAILENVFNVLQQRSWSGMLAIKALQLLQKLLPLCCNNLEQLWILLEPQLSPALVHWYFHKDWETTDAVLEVLAVITGLGQTHTFLQTWFGTSALLKVAYLATHSRHSYLNASAFIVFGNMTEIPQCIGTDLKGVPNEAHLFEFFIRSLLVGSEGTIRHAAAQALCNWFKRGCIKSSDENILHKTFVVAAYELYWEVKLVAVDFWDEVLSSAVSRSPVDQEWEAFLRPLAEIGFCDALIGLVKDEDSSVSCKAADIVKRLVGTPQLANIMVKVPKSISEGESDIITTTQPMAAKLELPEETEILPTFTVEEKMLAIEETLNTNDMEAMEVRLKLSADKTGGSCSSSVTSETPDMESLNQELELVDQKVEKCLSRVNVRSEIEELTSTHRRCCNPISADAFVCWLQKLNLDELYEKTSQSTDLYTTNYESLLDDILNDNCESDNENGDDEKAMDCY